MYILLLLNTHVTNNIFRVTSRAFGFLLVPIALTSSTSVKLTGHLSVKRTSPLRSSSRMKTGTVHNTWSCWTTPTDAETLERAKTTAQKRCSCRRASEPLLGSKTSFSQCVAFTCSQFNIHVDQMSSVCVGLGVSATDRTGRSNR